jgi:hypothetical protein
MNDKLKIWMSQPMLYIPLSSGEVVVRHNHLMALQHQLVNLQTKHQHANEAFVLSQNWQCFW